VKDLNKERIINRETIIKTALVVVIVCLLPSYPGRDCMSCVLRLCTVKVGVSSQVKDLRQQSIINREIIINTALVVVIVCLLAFVFQYQSSYIVELSRVTPGISETFPAASKFKASYFLFADTRNSSIILIGHGK
jgi:hypothetical protein